MGDGFNEWYSRTFTPSSGAFSQEWSAGAGEVKRRSSTGENETKQKDADAALIVAQEKEAEDLSRRRATILSQTTSGFGPNTNLARSFLTTF